MALIIRRLASVVTALAISGAPAVLSACAALCVPGMDHAAVASVDLPAGHGHHALPATESHHHDGRVAMSPAAPFAAVATVAEMDHACCPDGPALEAAPVAVVRADAGALVAMAAVTIAPVVARHAAPIVRGFGPLVTVRSPARTPLVLRV